MKYCISSNSVSVYVNGEQRVFTSDTKEYPKILECIRNKDEEGFNNLFAVNPAKALFTLSDGKLVWNTQTNEIWMGTPEGDKKFPQDLYNAMVEFCKLSIPTDRLEKFAHKLLQHPEPKSVEQFYTYVSKYNFPLTEDGCFIAYKGVAQDFRSLHPNPDNSYMDNSPGKVVEMDRKDVDHNRSSLCSRGLHVADWSYVQSQYSGARKIAVKVDPRDVVSVPSDHDDAKIRTCRYQVLEEIQAPLTALVSDLDKKVSECPVSKYLADAEIDEKNIVFFDSDKEDVKETMIFVVVDDDSDLAGDSFDLESDSFCSFEVVSKSEFLKDVKLLKNKKSGYYPPMLELKQAYRKGLVKFYNLDQDLQNALLTLG